MNKYRKALEELKEELYLYWDEREVELYTELLEELVERATLKKVIFNSENDMQWSVCPNCGNDIEQFIHDKEQEIELEMKHCPCGQALDWSDEE